MLTEIDPPDKNRFMDLTHKAWHVLITGRSSTGKTTKAEQIIRTESKHDRVFIFDPESEFVLRFNADECTVCHDLAEMSKPDNKRICIYDCADSRDYHMEFDDFCYFCDTYARNSPFKVLVVADEIQVYVDDSSLPQSFQDCLERGRRFKLDMLYLSQAPNLLHNIIRTQTTEAIAFAQSDELAVKWNKNLGFVPEEIMALPDLHFIRKKVGHPSVSGLIEFKKQKK